MSETTERTVAEIIGGQPPALSDAAMLCAACGTAYDPPTTKRSPCCGDCWYPAGERAGYLPTPTPDDMLAWLRARGFRVDIQCYLDGDTSDGAFNVMPWNDEDDYPDSFNGPTLHAALEAAVRAVAEASDG